MKLPSLSLLFSNLINTFKRFPFAIISAIISTGMIVIQIHKSNEYNEVHQWLIKVAMSCFLAMLFQIAIVVFSERKNFSLNIKGMLQLIGILIIGSYYYSLPDVVNDTTNIRFMLFVLGLHLLIAFTPFSGSGEMNGFWQYNKIILLRILTSALYSGVLYAGLSIALVAIDKLFSVNVNYKLYGDLGVIIAGIFNTIFFLAGLPENFASLEQKTDYPKGLKVFTQYVLLPIITIYLLILYAYMFKIVYTHHWPLGWVSYLVLGFSVAGILSFLLIHPIRNEEGNKWVLTFSRFFYFAIFPLLILLFMAIQRRISDYGITELRYFVLILALWLLFIAIYFLVSKQKNIKIIPQSLCVLAFLCSFGQWGAFSVSLSSQTNHFERLMEKNKLLISGKLYKATKTVSFKERQQISSITDYLISKQGIEFFQPYYFQNLDSLMKVDSVKTYQQDVKILELINIKYAKQYSEDDLEDNIISYSYESDNDMEDIHGYDYYIDNFSFRFYKELKSDTTQFKYETDSVIMFCNSKTGLLFIKINNESPYSFNVSEFIKKLESKYGESNDKLHDSLLVIEGSDNRYEYKVNFKMLEARKDSQNRYLNDITGKIFIAKRK